MVLVLQSHGFAAHGFGLWPKMCRPSANTENSHHTREKTSGTQGTVDVHVY